MDVIPSGIEELDGITGIGGFPTGAIVELAGLSCLALEALVTRLGESDEHSSPVRLRTPRSLQDWPQLEDRIRTGSELVPVLVEDAASADWLADPERIQRLRGLAGEYRAVVVIAVRALLRITDVTMRPPQGLASAADIRIRLSSHVNRPDQITAQVVKNRFSRPGSESLLQLRAD